MLLPRTVCVECRRIWIASRPVALIREQCCGTLSRDRPANRGTENVSVPLKWRVGFRFDSLEWELRQTDGSYHAGFDSGSSGITRSRSLRQMRTILNCIGSSRYTMRNGGWTISRRRGPFGLRHHPADLGVVAQSLNARDQFIDESIAHIRNTLLGIPSSGRLQICHSGFGEANGDRGHSPLVEAEPRLCIRKGKFPPCLKVLEPGDHGPHEIPFLFSCLAVSDRLNHCDRAATARQEHWAVRARRLLAHPTRIHLQVGQGNNILGESGTHRPGFRPDI